MNKVHTLLGATALAFSAGAANAATFYIDNGVNFAPNPTFVDPGGEKVNNTSTSIKEEMTLKYRSSTDITYANGASLAVGDAVTTKGGLFNGLGGGSENIITSLNPGQVGQFGSADNGFNSNWFLSFTFDDLSGKVNGIVDGFPTLHYDSGTIKMLYSLDGSTWFNFMNFLVTDSALNTAGSPNLSLTGNIDFTGVDLTYANLFHDADSGISYYDFWLANGKTTMTFNVDQNTNPARATITPTAGGLNITSNHDGSVTTQIPEPGVLALLGFGLMGFAGSSRRKAA